MRIGHGYDAHTFTEGRPLVLGGVNIPYEKGLKAHSDGDAVIHALCDALLGAAGLGDIGTYFPDTEKQYENIDSRVLLREVVRKIDREGFRVNNVDITILAQAPRLLPYIDDMRRNLSDDMGISAKDVNVKATTTEGMGFVGRKEGIVVYSIAALEII
jgi:2-C-methyl-D-erythritol 2,4-cyclodiphosphate synthase